MACERSARGFAGERGLTFVETLVTLTVLTSVMVGLYVLLDSSNKLAKQETNVAEAQQSARIGIYELGRIIRQGRVGALYYGNAIFPFANNSPGGDSLTDISGNAHYIRKGTDVIAVRGILFGDKYSLSAGDVSCSGGCDTTTEMTITIRATSESGVVNFPAAGVPALAGKTRPFYFVVTDNSNQLVSVGARNFVVPLYYVGLVDTTGTWYTQAANSFTFKMNPQDTGAKKLNATSGGVPDLSKPFSCGAVDEVLFFVDEGPADATGSGNDTHPVLAEAALDPSTGRYDIQPLVEEVEDFQIAYGVDGVDGSTHDRGISPAKVDTSGTNKDEWVGNVANEIETTLTVSADEPKRIDAFMDTTLSPAADPAPGIPALRSVWISLVAKSTDPDFVYGGPGARGMKVLDSAAVSFSASSATGRPYRRRLQSFAVSMRNYQ